MGFIDWLNDKDWFTTMKLSYPNRGISQVANLAAKWLLSKKPIQQGQTSWLMPNWDQFKVKSDHGHGQNSLKDVESQDLVFMCLQDFLIWNNHHRFTKILGNWEPKVSCNFFFWLILQYYWVFPRFSSGFFSIFCSFFVNCCKYLLNDWSKSKSIVK